MANQRSVNTTIVLITIVFITSMITSNGISGMNVTAQTDSSSNLTSSSTSNATSSSPSDLDKKMQQLASSNDPKDIAILAYIWGYPLVTAQVTKDYFTNPDVPQGIGYGPSNQFHPARDLIKAGFKEVVRPNSDTLYHQAWLDLKNGPLILQVPNIVDRYFVLPFLDAYGNQFKYIGTRTTGEIGGTYIVVGPISKGTLPANLSEATTIQSPTNLVWVIGRILVKGADDVQNVHDIQDKITLTPVMQNAISTPGNGTIFPTADNIKKLGIDYFDILSNALVNNSPPANQSNLVKKFETIGIGPGMMPSKDVTDQNTIEALSVGISEGEKMIDGKFANLGTNVNGWTFNLKTGVYGEDYLLRAAATKGGFGALSPEEALYPSTLVDGNGTQLNAANNARYVIHFNEGQAPPVKAFWSVTMYDKDGFFVDNPINRYNIGDRTVGLKNNTDGSFDIYIESKNPGPQKESNWLPAPDGPFTLALRMYIPGELVLKGEYKIPPVQRVS